MISKKLIDKLDQNFIAEDNLDLIDNFVIYLARNGFKNPQKRADKLIFNWNIHAPNFNLDNFLFKKLNWNTSDYYKPFDHCGILKIIGMIVTSRGPHVVIAEKVTINACDNFYHYFLDLPHYIKKLINENVITFID